MKIIKKILLNCEMKDCTTLHAHGKICDILICEYILEDDFET